MLEDRAAELIGALEKISARILETSITTSQLASSATPEMRKLFDKWLSCLEDEIERIATENTTTDIASASDNLGVSPETFLSLVLALARKGRLSVVRMDIEKGDGKLRDMCDCLN